jgi:hypothetical protein
VKERRDRWHADLADVPVERFVFVDEAGSTTAMQRIRGRSPKGQRCVVPGPQRGIGRR